MPDLLPIGLTGSIAGGKSTVLGMLADLGLRVASNDGFARQVFADATVQAALAERLGVPMPVAPARLREAMLHDPELRRWTNRLMHPLVGGLAARSDAEVFEVPLLFEACLQGRYREVWTVSCGDEERSRRLKARYGPTADPKDYGAWQLPEHAKEGLADVVIRTDMHRDHVLALVVTEVARCFPERVAHPG